MSTEGPEKESPINNSMETCSWSHIQSRPARRALDMDLNGRFCERREYANLTTTLYRQDSEDLTKLRVEDNRGNFAEYLVVAEDEVAEDKIYVCSRLDTLDGKDSVVCIGPKSVSVIELDPSEGRSLRFQKNDNGDQLLLYQDAFIQDSINILLVDASNNEMYFYPVPPIFLNAYRFIFKLYPEPVITGIFLQDNKRSCITMRLNGEDDLLFTPYVENRPPVIHIGIN